MDDESSVDDLQGTPFEPVSDAHDELGDADDDELIRLLYAYDRDEAPGEEQAVGELMGSLASHALARFTLEERGYTLAGDPGDLVVYDADDEPVAPDFVDIDP